MVETRHQSASNEENLRSLELLEEGEVSPTPTIQKTDGTIAEALKLLNSGASTLGFTAADIQAYVVLHCTYSTYVPYSLSPYRVLNSDTASALALLSRHIVISPLSS